ncbi:Gfo/Idh/MocA family oxidoreductase [Phytoactinopolyspora alkaliphila]|uniref:Gfo/Idh/MocA family oxidoreductase n=2 Tax=Phytoactinopolyspora alkaliphila TaxID=1783498 RepID=A0A6N9YT03_9ACTN|nr:Gfo/Idh/MocA family oxidoreductase [Phytoactinopolyspora alkaliphila]NED98173.1 Gfo/Idh/MocA family oxidoreductase [Phytoactinopolyspora alkaliphila]
MRWGIIGCGVISTAHAVAVRSLGESSSLVAAYDIERAKTKAFAAREGCAAEETLDALLGRDDVDSVAVCVPSGLHAEIAVAALEAGKHVVVEKPLDITLEAADRIIEAERSTGKVVTTISQRRFEPASEFIHRAVHEGALGKITSGTAECTWWRSQQYYASAGWRGTWSMDGGGALMNQGVHQADMLLWMLGTPVEVTAYADTLAHDGLAVEDTVAAVVRFESGAIATLSATTSANPGLPLRLSVHGDGGIAVLDGNELGTFTLADPNAADGSTLVDPGRSAEPAFGGGVDDWRARYEREAAALRSRRRAAGEPDPGGMNHPAQYADFVDAVQTGRAPAVTTADGRRALELVLGVYESARSGKPVTLGPGR